MAQWQFREPVETPPDLLALVEGHPLVARLLAQYGLTDPQRVRAFLDPAYYTPTSPYALPGMAEAVACVRQSIAQGKRIRIWGDFDADGQTATAILFEALSALGAQVDFRLPLRHEGHGLHPRVIYEAIQEGIGLLITCDTGTGDLESAEIAHRAGLALIITDHHDLGASLPKARAFLNPKVLKADHPLRELAGAGVAYLLAKALLEGTPHEGVIAGVLDLVALGLIADVAAQVNEVRYLCQLGLAALRATARPGLAALMALAHVDQATLTERDISYQLGPRLNAVGRLADAAEVVELLLMRDPARAQALAEKLEALNLDRRLHTEMLMRRVLDRLEAEPELLRQGALVVEGEDWEPGVLGLVAGDLARRYQRPTILIAHRPNQPSVASARSVEGVDIHEAIAAQGDLLLREGGHPMAAGFTIARENVPAFRARLLEYLRAKAITAPPPEPVLWIDAHVPPHELTLDLARALGKLAPHGPLNPRPTFMVAQATMLRAEDVRRDQQSAHRHLYLDLGLEEPTRFTWFNAGPLPEADERIDVAFYIGVDAWKGHESLLLEVVDWRPASAQVEIPTPPLIGGREVVDWRFHADREALYAHLRAAYGDRIVWWGEGAEGLFPEAVSRLGLPEDPRPALAILTAPAGPGIMREVLARVRPQVVYILPLFPLPDETPDLFIQKVAGLLQAALRQYEGWLDIPRMASRIGAREEAVRIALQGLAARGHIALWEIEGRWRAFAPQEAKSPQEVKGARPVPKPSLAEAREALGYLLRETNAYRRAFMRDPLEGLLRGLE